MRIIISPAKQMLRRDDELAPATEPALIDRAQKVLAWLRSLDYDALRRMWGCSDKLAHKNFDNLQTLDLHARLTPAVLAYDGIAFKYMAPSVFETGQFAYVQEHLRILSGFYGILRPMDGVVPYRLEMQAKATVGNTANLYEYWAGVLYDELMRGNDDRVIVNLASKEYSDAIVPYLQAGDRFITCVFAQENAKGALVQKGVYCKMARGEMVRFMAASGVHNVQDLKRFDSPDWRYCPERSSADNLVFLRTDRGER